MPLGQLHPYFSERRWSFFHDSRAFDEPALVFFSSTLLCRCFSGVTIDYPETIVAHRANSLFNTFQMVSSIFVPQRGGCFNRIVFHVRGTGFRAIAFA